MEETKAGTTYSCRNCFNPIALGKDLISKSFMAKSGQAFLFSHAMNVVIGPKVERKLLTGTYVVANVTCGKCGEELGWKYVQTYDLKQRFKEGMFVLEKFQMVKQY